MEEKQHTRPTRGVIIKQRTTPTVNKLHSLNRIFSPLFTLTSFIKSNIYIIIQKEIHTMGKYVEIELFLNNLFLSWKILIFATKPHAITSESNIGLKDIPTFKKAEKKHLIRIGESPTIMVITSHFIFCFKIQFPSAYITLQPAYRRF